MDGAWFAAQRDKLLERSAHPERETVERETGFEPATNSLEGCDSTPELLPLNHSATVVTDEPIRAESHSHGWPALDDLACRLGAQRDAGQMLVEADGFEPS